MRSRLRPERRMPHFFFHVRTPTDYVVDEDGVELPDIIIASQYARSTAKTINEDSAMVGGSTDSLVFEVMDASSNLLLTIPFVETAGMPRQSD